MGFEISQSRVTRRAAIVRTKLCGTNHPRYRPEPVVVTEEQAAREYFDTPIGDPLALERFQAWVRSMANITTEDDDE